MFEKIAINVKKKLEIPVENISPKTFSFIFNLSVEKPTTVSFLFIIKYIAKNKHEIKFARHVAIAAPTISSLKVKIKICRSA